MVTVHGILYKAPSGFNFPPTWLQQRAVKVAGSGCQQSSSQESEPERGLSVGLGVLLCAADTDMN